MDYLTQAIYEASKPDAFKDLFAISQIDQGARESKARELHDQGYVIDRQIEIWGWDAGKVMAYRQILGFTTSPSAIFSPSDTPTSIKVSIDAADYPPFHPPAPPEPVGSPVGAVGSIAGVYSIRTQAIYDGNGKLLYKEGDPFTLADGTVVTFHQQMVAPFNMVGYSWETAAAKAARIAGGG